MREEESLSMLLFGEGKTRGDWELYQSVTIRKSTLSPLRSADKFSIMSTCILRSFESLDLSLPKRERSYVAGTTAF